MLMFGVNFNIYYLLLARDFKLVFKNEELRFYIITVLVSVTVIAINIRSMFSSWFDAFHHSFFQVSSIITTTGFSTTDFRFGLSFRDIFSLCSCSWARARALPAAA